MSLKFSLVLIGCIVAFLFTEFFFVGYTRSSIRRISINRSEAFKDCLYFLATVLFSYFMGSKLNGLFRWDFGRSWGAVTQFLFLALLDSFAGYWHHRLCHRWLWSIHKVHHSATVMTGINSFRNHPLELFTNIPSIVLIGNLSALNPRVTLVYGLLNIFYQLWVHTEWYWCPSVIRRWVIIDPALHRIHHSVRLEDHDRNFGTLVIWDRVFGTFKDTDLENITIGI